MPTATYLQQAVITVRLAGADHAAAKEAAYQRQSSLNALCKQAILDQLPKSNLDVVKAIVRCRFLDGEKRDSVIGTMHGILGDPSAGLLNMSEQQLLKMCDPHDGV